MTVKIMCHTIEISPYFSTYPQWPLFKGEDDISTYIKNSDLSYNMCHVVTSLKTLSRSKIKLVGEGGGTVTGHCIYCCTEEKYKVLLSVSHWMARKGCDVTKTQHLRWKLLHEVLDDAASPKQNNTFTTHSEMHLLRRDIFI